MEKITTFGDRMKEARETMPDKLSLETIGLHIGVSKQALNRYERNERDPKQPVIEALARYFGVSPLWLMGYDVDKHYALEKQLKKVPLIGTIAAGTPILAQENIIDYVCDISGKADFALKIKGNSMINARMFDGDIVLIRKQDDVESGEIAAILFDDTEEATIKRIYKGDNYIILHPENPTMSDIKIEKKDINRVRILGKAIQVIINL